MKRTLGALAALAATLSPHFAGAQEIDSGATAWMLTSTALVLLMTVPGLALFYGGLVRTRNVLSVLMQCFALCCVISLIWVVFGYSLAFDSGNGLLGGLSKAWLGGVEVDSVSGAIPETVFSMFQLTFAIITPALIIGAVVERMKFKAFAAFIALWVLLVYCPIAHMVWSGKGYFFAKSAIDFAGGLVVHCSAGFSALVAAFVSHRRGIYYALLTIAFGQIVWFVPIKWHSVTGGEDGLLNLQRLPAEFGFARVGLQSNDALFGFTLTVFALVVVGLWRLVHSPFGRVLQAIRQNETRAAFAGYNVWLYKWLAFVISAAVAGLAGALFAMAQQSAYPNVMSLHQSGFVVMMVLVGGGLISFWGPVVGALFFILARDLLGAYTETWLLWYGLLFMAVVLFKPEGLVGLVRDWRARRRPAVTRLPAREAG